MESQDCEDAVPRRLISHRAYEARKRHSDAGARGEEGNKGPRTRKFNPDGQDHNDPAALRAAAAKRKQASRESNPGRGLQVNSASKRRKSADARLEFSQLSDEFAALPRPPLQSPARGPPAGSGLCICFI